MKQAKLIPAFQSKMLGKCFIIGIGMGLVANFANAESLSVPSEVRTSVVRTDPRTGKLVRKMIAFPATQQTQSSDVATPSLHDLIDSIAEKNEVEPFLVHSVIRAESNYNPLAVSNKGAQGLMQLIPSTAKRFGVKDSFDSKENVEGGVKYLKYLIDLFHGDYSSAVAAYNAGEKAVTRYGGVPPYKETQHYVETVSRHLEEKRRAFVPKSKVASVAPAASDSLIAPAETSHPVIASVSQDGRVFYRTP